MKHTLFAIANAVTDIDHGIKPMNKSFYEWGNEIMDTHNDDDIYQLIDTPDTFHDIIQPNEPVYNHAIQCIHAMMEDGDGPLALLTPTEIFNMGQFYQWATTHPMQSTTNETFLDVIGECDGWLPVE